MGVFGGIEADPAAVRIREAATRRNLSHALLITGGGPDRLSAMARYAAAALECEGNPRPCGTCPACRKILRDIHPDVVTVRDEQHKQISADVTRAVRSDTWVRPNEGERKVYLFPDCALLTERDQNILLKVVEEGPPYAAFVFCAEDSAAVLRTLRSRCVEVKLRPVSEPGAGDAGDGEELCRRVCRGMADRRRGTVTEYTVRLERSRISREALAELLGWCYGAFAAALLNRYGREPEGEYRDLAPFLAERLDKKQIVSAMETFRKYHGECAWQVGPNHVLGALAAELEGFH